MQKERLHINNFKLNSGFSLVEILVALAVFLVFATTIINLNLNSDKQLKRVVNSERASSLAEEALEAVRNIRDESFTNLVDGTYGVVSTSTNKWELSGSSDSSDIFTRNVVISTIDANKKQILATVNWSDQISSNNSVALKSYLTNWQSFSAPAGLTLKKVIVNYFSTKVLNDFASYTATTGVGTSTATSTFVVGTAVETPANTFTFLPLTLSPGNYVVAEKTDPNYTQTFSGDCNATSSIILASGDAKVCTITNEEKYATLTVTKTVVNNGGSKTASDFAPYKYGTSTIVENVATKVPPGTYTISEIAASDYTALFGGQCSVGGSITLAVGDNKTCSITNTQASWANPNTQAGILDITGTNDGLKIRIQGQYAYIVKNAGTPDFVIVNISNPAAPTLTGSLTLTGTPSNIYVSGNYAYVSSDDNAQELQIINITNPAAPVLAGTFDAVGNNNANTVFVVGNIAYLGRANAGTEQDFVVINVANPAAPVLLGTLNTLSTTYKIEVSGNYAYLASADNSAELKIINIASSTNPIVVGGYNATTNTDAISLAINGSIALIGQGSNLHKINITNPASPTLLGTYAVGGTVNDISIWSGASYAFLATSNGAAELRVVNFAPNTPTLVGDYNATVVFNGVAYDTATNKAYMVGTLDTGELIIIQP